MAACCIHGVKANCVTTENAPHAFRIESPSEPREEPRALWGKTHQRGVLIHLDSPDGTSVAQGAFKRYRRQRNCLRAY